MVQDQSCSIYIPCATFLVLFPPRLSEEEEGRKKGTRSIALFFSALCCQRWVLSVRDLAETNVPSLLSALPVNGEWRMEPKKGGLFGDTVVQGKKAFVQ